MKQYGQTINLKDDPEIRRRYVEYQMLLHRLQKNVLWHLVKL